MFYQIYNYFYAPVPRVPLDPAKRRAMRVLSYEANLNALEVRADTLMDVLFVDASETAAYKFSKELATEVVDYIYENQLLLRGDTPLVSLLFRGRNRKYVQSADFIRRRMMDVWVDNATMLFERGENDDLLHKLLHFYSVADAQLTYDWREFNSSVLKMHAFSKRSDEVGDTLIQKREDKKSSKEPHIEYANLKGEVRTLPQIWRDLMQLDPTIVKSSIYISIVMAILDELVTELSQDIVVKV